MVKIKTKRFVSWQKILALMGLCLLVVVSVRHPLDAQAVSNGFGSDTPIQRGMIVRLKEGDSTKVEPVDSDASDQMHGIVVAANDAPVTLTQNGRHVFIATAGHYDVVVSNQNGTINTGDYVTVSAIAGVGMKATTKEPFIIGRALSTFDGTKDLISSTQTKDSNGGEKNINIGRVQVDIGVAKNPNLKATEPNVPKFLQKAANTIAGRPVNAIRIYVGILVFGISTMVAASLMYGGVRSAITSIGRNPLGKKSIVRTMFQVVLTGLIVFITGVFGVYLILRL